jgi:predicted enzyme related to lactoylglutathione lyase
MKLIAITLAGLLSAGVAAAQESGIHVRSIRVLATDPDALATFYKNAFGMSETRRPADRPTFKEIALNSGSTVDLAKKSTTTPIVIATRPKDAPAGAMASLILEVPDLEKAIASVTKHGGKLQRPAGKSAEGLNFAFVFDPDGNQIELVNTPK